MRRWELRQGWKRKLISPLAAAAAVIAGLLPAAVYAQSSAVVIMYHRFGESEYPSTNTTLEQLDAHIAELTSGPYSVLPLPRPSNSKPSRASATAHGANEPARVTASA